MNKKRLEIWKREKEKQLEEQRQSQMIHTHSNNILFRSALGICDMRDKYWLCASLCILNFSLCILLICIPNRKYCHEKWLNSWATEISQMSTYI